MAYPLPPGSSLPPRPPPPVAPQPDYQQQPQQYYSSNTYEDTYNPTPPQIRNPFVAPASGSFPRPPGTMDPEMEAQIAQWQSAYTSRDERRPAPISSASAAAAANRASEASLTASEMSNAAASNTGVASVVTGADGKQKTVVRKGGGQTWQDPSLLEWDPAHFRLFVGNLAGEVTDESLLKAFARYDSVQKARVVRDKRTTKSKGFGFVSFSDGDEYFRAAKEMQGKYIGSHPVLLRKSTTEIKAVTPKEAKRGKGGKGGGGGGGDRTGAGVQKKVNKTKGGLKIIG